MVTVRELIQSLITNCNLDDHVEVEFTIPCKSDPDSVTYRKETVRHIFHCGNDAIIECHDY